MVNQVVSVSVELKERMNSVKVHPRETYSDIIERGLDLIEAKDVN